MIPRKRALLERGACLALLTLVPLAVLAPLIRSGDLPVDLRAALFEPPWQEARPAGMDPPGDALSHLETQRYYPGYAYLALVAEEGHSLLWNDTAGFGMPFLGLWRTRALSPFSIPFYVLPLSTAFALSVLAKLLIAGWCAWYAARRFAFPPPLALFIALSYQLGAPLAVMPAAPLADAVPWLPLLVLRCERLALGDLRAWPRAAVVLALIALGGGPEILAVCLLFAVLYLGARRLIDAGRVRTQDAVTGLGLAFLFGAGLAAVQWAPFVEFLRHGRWSGGAAGVLPLGGLASFFAPGFTPPAAGRLAQCVHPGLVPLLLLPLWLSLRRFVEASHRRQLEAFLVAALVVAAFALLPGRVALPGSFSPAHFLPFLGLAGAFLAAGALEEWVRLDPEQCKATLGRFLMAAPVFWLACFAAIAAGLSRVATAPGTHGLALAIGSAVAVAVLLAVTLLKPRVGLLGYGLALVAAGGLWWGLYPLAPRTSQALAYPETPFVRTLRDVNTLAAGTEAMRDWPLASNGIRQVYTPGGAFLDRHEDFMAEVQRKPLLLRRTGAQALLLTRESVRGPFARIRHALRIHEIFASGAVLMRDLEAQPRARIIHAGRTMESYDPGLLSPALPPLIEGASLPEQDGGGPAAAVDVTEDAHDGRVAVRVKATRPGMLVLADAFYPGWTAEVDGTPAPVHAVDTVFRGVEVGLGDHEVVFRYEPLSLKIGMIISAAALLVVAYNHLPRVRRRR